jgi:uncharacterized LabA/DUF88 family protein
MSAGSDTLTKWIIKLGAEVRALLHRAPYLEAKTRAQELKRYEQALQVIYAEARRREVDLLPYYTALAEIESNMTIIRSDLPPPGPVEKIALFIDGANLNAVSYELKAKIDFAKLLSYFGQNAIILRAFYYIATDREGTNVSFLVWLKRNGYQVVTKPIKEFDDGTQKGNLDIEIAVDMLELADKVDRVVLFSGDGDFAPLIKRVGGKGTRTQVVAYWGHGEGATAPELMEAADIFTELQDIIRLISRN